MKTFIIILCGLISFTSISQTTVSGIISNNTIWTLNNSPYIITGNTLIMSGFELEVQNGVEVLFDGNYSINVYGRITCNGTENSKIKFSRTSNYTNNWNKITLNNSDSSVFQHCIFEYANIGIEVFNVRIGNPLYTSNHPRIYNSKFKDCIRGIYVDGNRDGYCDISHNIFTGNQIGVDVDFGEPLISYNRFINSLNHAIYSDSPTCGGGNYCNNNSPQIIGNNFLNNFCDVIKIDDNKAIINDNTFDISFESINLYNFSAGWHCITMSGIAKPTLQGNNFMDSILFLDLSVNPITGSGNYFNAPNSSINNLVNDFFDNPNLGFFQNNNTLTYPNTNAPLSTLNNLNINKCGNTYTLNWDIPNELDYQKIYITDTLNNILDSLDLNKKSFNVIPPFQIIAIDSVYPNNFSNYSIAIEPNEIYTYPSDVFNTDLIVGCDNYTWIDGVTYYSDTNSAIFTLQTANGCDSIITLNLTINNSTTSSSSITACDSYVWMQNNMAYTTSGVYADTIPNAAGCDSILTLNLTINNATASSSSVTACDSYVWMQNNITYTTSGVYADTIPNAAGCDSILTLNLTINNATASSSSITACDSYTWIQNNITYTTSGVYADTIPNAAGCDSILTLNLTINNATASSSSITACDSYVWMQNNITYTTSGVYADTIPNAAGCDSILTLNLTINNATASSSSITACDSYVWMQNNITYTTSGVYADTIPNVAGCDSIATLNLVIINSTTSSSSVTACDSYTWIQNNITYTTSGVYADTIPNAAGCDSILTLNLTINNATASSSSITACDSYVWMQNNMTYISSGVYVDTIPNATGCDSIITLNLTINNSTASSSSVTACDSYVWLQNNMTYTSSGVYVDTIPNAAGCDSIITLNLTINNSTASSSSVTACDSYVWLQNNMTYNTSGVYVDTIPNAAGCDSIITLNLTIINSTASSSSVTACDSYVWSQNNMTYISSGVYVDTIPNATGCDSIITLNLTINNSTASSSSVTACDSYVWLQNNMTYTSSGVYVDTIPNAVGCDSIITLNLTINNSTASSSSVTACDSYVWLQNNMTYNTSGVYVDTIPNAAGCDSIITLNLMINNSTASSSSVTECDSYVWSQNNMTYTSSGVYVDTIPNAAGCDSILTLNLTINTLDLTISLVNDSLVSNDANATAYQWVNCDSNNVNIAGATNAGFQPLYSGNYAVILTNGACVDTSACQNIVINSTKENRNTSSITIFPIPTSGQVYIQLEGISSTKETIQVYSLEGELILDEVVNSSQIELDLSSFVRGIYLVKYGQTIRKVVLTK